MRKLPFKPSQKSRCERGWSGPRIRGAGTRVSARALAAGSDMGVGDLGGLESHRTRVSAPMYFLAPAPPAPFVGREEELELVVRLLSASEPAAVAIASGLGGVGKTALAAKAAEELSAHFVDGVLWARLEGGDSGPVLAHFIRCLNPVGLWPENVATVRDLSLRFREIVASRRCLIVLDDVRTSEEIETFFPPGSGSRLLYTTKQPGLRPDGVEVSGCRHRHPRHFIPLYATELGAPNSARYVAEE
jgi:hypothetical protein